jgi:hypothetical protein
MSKIRLIQIPNLDALHNAIYSTKINFFCLGASTNNLAGHAHSTVRIGDTIDADKIQRCYLLI